MSVISGYNLKLINKIFSEKTRFENILKKFLSSNIFGHNEPISSGNELGSKI